MKVDTGKKAPNPAISSIYHNAVVIQGWQSGKSVGIVVYIRRKDEEREETFCSGVRAQGGIDSRGIYIRVNLFEKTWPRE